MVNFNIPLILASNSPRRKQLLEDAGFKVTVVANQVSETFPDHLDPASVAEYLARKKAGQFDSTESGIILTADTIVTLGDRILGKPADYEEGFALLRLLSGKGHDVITGVCLRQGDRLVSFDDLTRVVFKDLSDEEIDYYLTRYFPYDKAGAYGIQEWLGMIAVERIEGSYYNVVGLPVHKVCQVLRDFS